MSKHVFQGLKRTFMNVSGLPPPYFDFKKNYYILVFLSNYDEGRPEACINVHFRASNASLCMSQVLPHHILI